MIVKYGNIVKVSLVNYFQSTSKKNLLKDFLNPFPEGHFQSNNKLFLYYTN